MGTAEAQPLQSGDDPLEMLPIDLLQYLPDDDEPRSRKWLLATAAERLAASRNKADGWIELLATGGWLEDAALPHKGRGRPSRGLVKSVKARAAHPYRVNQPTETVEVAGTQADQWMKE